MKDIVNTILDETKLAYKESILIENKIIEDKLLSIMANAKLLLNELETVKLKKKKKYKQNENTQALEVEKVKRKVPLWLKKQNQYNYKILNTFMSLSNNNKHTISTRLLEMHCNIDPKVFLSNYNLLKTVSEKNHGKVFSEKDGQVTLWEPIKEIVMEYFK